MRRAAALLVLLLATPAQAQDALARLKADLLSQGSATATLTHWCADLKLATPPVIRARRDAVTAPASAETRALLAAGPDEAIGYRRVKLMCGSHVLSEADNWYLPSRLTPEMNHTLDTSDTPFGAVVRPLNYSRATLDAQPVADGPVALRVRALLKTAAGQPFSLVVENYSRALVAPQ
ncbi:MAG TPA: hypothetical protein VFQ69_01440 [Rhizomicrobium sp.]|jgi:hypothetical protein|nr:hypothetical protein [Rhizomicrobium sp.]